VASAFGGVGGLIAQSVVSSRNEDADSRVAQQLRAHLAGISARDWFAGALGEALRDGGRFREVRVSGGGPAPPPADAVATFRLKDWGFRLPAPAISRRFAAFVEIEARMVQGSGSRVVWDEHDVVLGLARLDLETLRSDGAALRTELEATFRRAAARMARHLLHPREPAP